MKVGVIGAGTMGQGIAKAFAQVDGYTVALCDIKQEWAEGGKDKIAKGYARLVHFGGRNSDFFYNLANICKALGIKFNIAMLYLADEMFKNRHKTFTVTFGKPIPWQTFDKSKTPAQWAEYVKDIVYKL